MKNRPTGLYYNTKARKERAMDVAIRGQSLMFSLLLAVVTCAILVY